MQMADRSCMPGRNSGSHACMQVADGNCMPGRDRALLARMHAQVASPSRQQPLFACVYGQSPGQTPMPRCRSQHTYMPMPALCLHVPRPFPPGVQPASSALEWPLLHIAASALLSCPDLIVIQVCNAGAAKRPHKGRHPAARLPDDPSALGLRCSSTWKLEIAELI